MYNVASNRSKAEEEASNMGHQLGSWEQQEDIHKAKCTKCDSDIMLFPNGDQTDLLIGGDAASHRCKVKEASSSSL